jgi:hypothetical protein
MIDLSAPIIPGVGAAGIHPGQFIERTVLVGTSFVREAVSSPFVGSSDTVRYRSESGDLWVADSLIQQIGAHGVYRAKALGQSTPGMTIDDIERLIGPRMEDSEDKLVIAGVEGLCFDVDWRPDQLAKELDSRLPELHVAPITWFFTCQVQSLAQYPFRTLYQATRSGGETPISSARLSPLGIGSWSPIIRCRGSVMAARVSRSTSSRVSPAATQPGRSGAYAPYPLSPFSLMTRTRRMGPSHSRSGCRAQDTEAL